MKILPVFYCILIFILIARVIIFYENVPSYKENQSVSFETTVSASPKVYLGYQTLYLRLDNVNKILVKTDLEKVFYYGDSLKISGNIEKRVLKDGGYIFTINYPKIEANFRENLIFNAFIQDLRQKIITFFKSNLDQVKSNLMLGIVFGIKENFPKFFKDNLETAGVMHVIAASGMNITMLSAFVFYLLTAFLRRQIAIIFSILGIIFYAAIAGFEPSIIRAAIMGIIVFSAQIVGRQKYALNTLLITGFLMLLVYPGFLTDIGFQLSFLATFGLIYIPEFFKKITNAFTQDLITTVSAQIATLPVLLSNFGNYSILSIAVNALVLWTIPILMILGGAAFVVSFVFDLPARIILYLCLPFLYIFEGVVNFFAGFGNTLQVSGIPWQFQIAYYLFLLSFIAFKIKTK